jgi:hypothetical protein
MRLRSLLLSFTLLCSHTLAYSTDRFGLDDYFDQVSSKSPYPIASSHREALKKYYNDHDLGPHNILKKEELTRQRQNFNNQRSSLIEEWSIKTRWPWPTYTKDMLCKRDGECYWKRSGDLFDVHHIFPLSHKGPNHALNIWPVATNDHTSLHATFGPCCDIFPTSCGSRGSDIKIADHLTGWTKKAQSRSLNINGKHAVITKFQQTKSKHYYKIKVGGKNYHSLKEAKKAAIVRALMINGDKSS